MPALISLPAFCVVALKTPTTPTAATVPSTPTTSADTNSLRPRFIASVVV